MPKFDIRTDKSESETVFFATGDAGIPLAAADVVRQQKADNREIDELRKPLKQEREALGHQEVTFYHNGQQMRPAGVSGPVTRKILA